MLLQKLQDLAADEVEAEAARQNNSSPPNHLAKVYLDKHRKNLCMLLCQSDIAELTGALDAFGGEADVKQSISRAIFNLFCLAKSFSLDMETILKDFVAERTGEPIQPKTDVQPEDKEAGDTKNDAGPSAEAEKPPTEADNQAASTESVPSEKISEAMEQYIGAFNTAHTIHEVSAIWKQIVNDPRLVGKERYRLQRYKFEAHGRFK